MNRIVLYGLALIGSCSVILTVGILISIAGEKIGDLMRKAKVTYRCKHRFNKKPIAKCYCIDCEWYDMGESRCYIGTEPVTRCADNWFCKGAEPRKER